MIKRFILLKQLKSSALIVGLFCLWLLVSGCNRTENPDDVTIAFWTALIENDLETAATYSTEGSIYLFDEKLRNAALQIGKVRYDCDGASVETQISLQSAQASSSFKTILIRDTQEDVWKVDYPRTIINLNPVSDKHFKNVITTTKATGKAVNEKVQFKTFFKELWQAIVTVFRTLKNRLLS